MEMRRGEEREGVFGGMEQSIQSGISDKRRARG